MAKDDFFPIRPAVNPRIYAYADSNPMYECLLKVGYTTVDTAARVAQQYPTLRPGALPYTIVLDESAMRPDGSQFDDHAVHRLLRSRGIPNPEGEWFRCSPFEVQAAIVALQRGATTENRTQTFAMRPEQARAVEKTAAYFEKYRTEEGRTPHFLWNCKMRFGKTFAAYQLARRMGWKRVLVLTFKPAVQSAWDEDLRSHVDFEGWQFVTSRGEQTYATADHSRPIVWFESFQDILGKGANGTIKIHNEDIHCINWDCVIFDEYHFGAWRDKAKDIFLNNEDERADAATRLAEEEEIADEEGMAGQEYFDEDIIPITSNAFLYLSGTPFRAIAGGEFIEEQIFNWTYSDEQRAKEEWQGERNPYASLPRMVLMTYQLPEAIKMIAEQGEYDEFDLNEFFKASGKGEAARFAHESDVQKWLDIIRGGFAGTTVDELKQGAHRPPMPYQFAPLADVLQHTLWFLPNVASCRAMKNLLAQNQNTFYHKYTVVCCAGTSAGIGINALTPVLGAMNPNPLRSLTITLTCGKLTTGVSVKPWTGIFMLRNTTSPETYFQSAFRVQTPWTVRNPDGTNPNQEEIIKQECYIFDFAPNRALRQIADYACRLSGTTGNPEQQVDEFVKFLPVLCYDGNSMKRLNPAGILDLAMSGTTATLLARRWESALLVNVDNDTLRRLMGSSEAMDALMNIEGFRSLNQDIETIINSSEAIKKTRKEAADKELDKEQQRELSAEEKEMKSRRKQIQEKLIKFATRVPVFMYLTDYRERKLVDVITQLEPALFRKVTGLRVKDFELLVSLGVFNSAVMNKAVLAFKRYEDDSLSYTGIDYHENESIGGWDTVVVPINQNHTLSNQMV